MHQDVNNRLREIHETCLEEQEETGEICEEVTLLHAMLRQDTVNLNETFQRAKNVLNSSMLTSKYDSINKQT